MTLTIPIVPPPGNDETLTSWTARIGAANLMPITWVMKAAGWTQTNHYKDTVTGFGITLHPDQAAGLSAATGVPSDRIQQMVLTTWAGTLACDTDKHGNNITHDAQKFAINNWLYTKGSHYCPQCLGENDGAWQLSWKSPFTFACLTHGTALLTHCPTCQQRADQGRADGSSRPAFPTAIPQPGRCHNPQAQTGESRSKGACLHDHTSDDPGLAMPEQLLAAQKELHGTDKQFEQWNDVIALTVYSLTVHTLENVEHLLQDTLPPEIRHAWAAQHDERAQRLAENRRRVETENIDFREGSQDTTRRTPPTDPLSLSVAATLAHHAYKDDNFLRAFIQHGRDEVHQTPASRFTNLNASSALIERSRRAHVGDREVLLEAGLDSRYVRPTRHQITWNPEHLPPYLWPHLYDKHLTELFSHVAVTERTARKFAIIALYRSATGTTWNQAAKRHLDGALKSARLPNAVLHNLKNSQMGDLRQSALLAITDIAKGLDQDAVDQYHADKQWADKHLTRPIPYDVYKPALAPGQAATRARRLSGAVWLWTHHTLGDRIDAPAWPTPPTDLTLDVHRTWLRETSDNTKDALLLWAHTLR